MDSSRRGGRRSCPLFRRCVEVVGDVGDHRHVGPGARQALLAVLNVSFGAGMLAWAVFVPVGFMLDPLFHRVGHWLLIDATSLRPLWTTWDNTPVLAVTNFNNTVVLGSVVIWLLLFVPIYLASRFAVVRYRATLGERVRQSHFYKVLSASQAYNVYRWFRP